MSAKSILEADGKAILNYHLTRAPVIKPTPLPASSTHNAPPKLASLYFAADADVKGVLDQAETTYPWLLAPGAKFVAKPDQLIKRRGKSGLLALNKSWQDARAWIEARAGKPQKVETVEGVLRQFLVEPFVPHPQDTEYYININSVREVCLLPLFLYISFTSCGSRESGRVFSFVHNQPKKTSGWRFGRAAADVCCRTGGLPFCLTAPDEGKLARPTAFCALALPISSLTFTCQISLVARRIRCTGAFGVLHPKCCGS